MPSAATIILEYVCPSLGIITANIMFAAPFEDCQKAIARGSLGDLNPLPWVFMLGNTFGWVTYSFLINNLFVFFANAPGLLMAAWFNLAASKLLFRQQFTRIPSDDGLSTTSDDSPPPPPVKGQSPNAQETLANSESTALSPPLQVPRHDYYVMAMSSFWMAIIALIGFGHQSLSPETRQLIVGVVTNLILVFFYGSPLSTIWTVLQTRNTATIHGPTMLTNTLNAIFWTAYGIAVSDFFIAVPNGLGAVLGGIQMALCVFFPRVDDSSAVATDDNNNEESKDKDIAQAAMATSKTELLVENSESPLVLPFASSSSASTTEKNKVGQAQTKLGPERHGGNDGMTHDE